MSRSDHELVSDALSHLDLLHKHLLRADLSDQTVSDAVCMRLFAAIEAVGRGSDQLRNETFGQDWPLMWATRNRIAHGYAFIDMSVIAATIQHDLPRFEDQLRAAASQT